MFTVPNYLYKALAEYIKSWTTLYLFWLCFIFKLRTSKPALFNYITSFISFTLDHLRRYSRNEERFVVLSEIMRKVDILPFQWVEPNLARPFWHTSKTQKGKINRYVLFYLSIHFFHHLPCSYVGVLSFQPRFGLTLLRVTAFLEIRGL